MFAVIYRFRVKPGAEDEFARHWRAVTLALRSAAGALGSRLHRSADGSYVAYARWPSREAWAAPHPLPEEAERSRRAMKDSCDTIETTHEMTVVDDLL